MIKKTVTYENFDGVTVTEDLYFNLTKVELFEAEVIGKDGVTLSDYLRVISTELIPAKIIEALTTILKLAYGVRSEDGKRFIKNDEVWESFRTSEAYSEFVFGLYSDPEGAADFIAKLAPAMPTDHLPASDSAPKTKPTGKIEANDIQESSTPPIIGNGTTPVASDSVATLRAQLAAAEAKEAGN